MALSAIEKKLLNKVLNYADNDLDRVESGIRRAIRGTEDWARRIYLSNRLRKEAKKIIRDESNQKIPRQQEEILFD